MLWSGWRSSVLTPSHIATKTLVRPAIYCLPDIVLILPEFQNFNRGPEAVNLGQAEQLASLWRELDPECLTQAVESTDEVIELVTPTQCSLVTGSPHLVGVFLDLFNVDVRYYRRISSNQ